MANHVTYTVELTPENAPKIDAVNRILLGDTYSEKAPAAKAEPKSEAPSKKETATKAEPKKEAPSKKQEPKKQEPKGPSVADLKAALKTAKSEHGLGFVYEVLEDADVPEAATLGRRVGAVKEEQYADVIAALNKGPVVTGYVSDEPEDDLDEDDGLDDDDEDESEVSAEAVKLALKAHSKEHGRDAAKEIMTSNGAAALSKVDDCTDKQLQAMMKALV